MQIPFTDRYASQYLFSCLDSEQCSSLCVVVTKLAATYLHFQNACEEDFKIVFGRIIYSVLLI